MRGTIIAIGGGMRLDGLVLAEFYRRSGGEYGEIVILPSAIQLPDYGIELISALTALGLRHPARILPVHTREDASNPKYCAAIENATGLFITGGDQGHLMDTLHGTPLYHAISSMLRLGGTVAGTSAGAAALSEVMIVVDEGSTLPYQDIARFDRGLGLIENCIFDQHFRQRNRIGRLIDAVSRYPGLLGIGVDEDTAAVIEENSLLVIGSGAVTIVDGAAMTTWDSASQPDSALIAFSGLQLHVLTHGNAFDLQARRTNTLDLRVNLPLPLQAALL